MKKNLIMTAMAFVLFFYGISQAQDSDFVVCRTAHELLVEVNAKNMGVSLNQGKKMWKDVRNSCSVNRTGSTLHVQQSYEFINQKTKRPLGGEIKYKMKLIYANNLYYLCELLEDTFQNGEYINRSEDFRRNIICSQ